MSGNKIEGLLNEVEATFEGLAGSVQELADLETQPAHSKALVEVIDAMIVIQNWIKYRKDFLKSERERLADQIIERELNLHENRMKTRQEQPPLARRFFKDLF